MWDLHCHILPGIDDGPAEIDEAAHMLKIAARYGTTGIVATPHLIEGAWLPAWSEIMEKCRQLQAMAEAMNLQLILCPGAEVFVSWEILGKISGPGPYCINGSRYMLVELPALEIPGFTDEFLFILQARGITPVLAHPERHPAIIREPGILEAWIRKGVLVQLNGPSLTGRFGEKVAHMAEYMLRNNMVHCIGSDAHGARIRKPNLAGVADRMRELGHVEQVDLLLRNKSQQIIGDCDLQNDELPYPQQMQPQNGLRSRLNKLLRACAFSGG